MKKTFRKLTVFAVSLLLTIPAASCGKNKNEDINDSRESNSSDNIPENGKQVITVGMPVENQLLLPVLNDFNSSGTSYEIKIIDYSTLVNNDDENYTKAMDAMKMDLVSGKAPDIIALNPGDMLDFIETGCFCDMYSLMEQYEGVKKEDFLPNVLKAFELENKLPAMSYCFTIHTAAAKNVHTGEGMEHWTVQDAIDAFHSIPEDMSFVAGLSAEEYMTEHLYDICVDYTNYSCDFHKPEFTQIFNFISAIPSDNYENSDSGMNYISDYDIVRNDKALIRTENISGFNQSLGNSFVGDFANEDFTFVGYPSYNGNGISSTASWMFGISESSVSKEAAWEFMNYLFSEDFQNSINEKHEGIPVIRKILDDQLENKDKTDYQSIYSAKIFDSDDNDENDVYISEDAVQKLYDYITNTELDFFRDEKIISMISEEYPAVINGEKTAEECADILQSRISVYLNEMK